MTKPAVFAHEYTYGGHHALLLHANGADKVYLVYPEDSSSTFAKDAEKIRRGDHPSTETYTADSFGCRRIETALEGWDTLASYDPDDPDPRFRFTHRNDGSWHGRTHLPYWAEDYIMAGQR